MFLKKVVPCAMSAMILASPVAADDQDVSAAKVEAHVVVNYPKMGELLSLVADLLSDALFDLSCHFRDADIEDIRVDLIRLERDLTELSQLLDSQEHDLHDFALGLKEIVQELDRYTSEEGRDLLEQRCEELADYLEWVSVVLTDKEELARVLQEVAALFNQPESVEASSELTP